MPKKLTKPEQPSLGPPCCGECSYCHPDSQKQIKCWVNPPQYIGEDTDGSSMFIRSAPVDVKYPACRYFDSVLKAN